MLNHNEGHPLLVYKKLAYTVAVICSLSSGKKGATKYTKSYISSQWKCFSWSDLINTKKKAGERKNMEMNRTEQNILIWVNNLLKIITKTYGSAK